MKYKFANVYIDENEKLEKAVIETDLGNIEVNEVDKFNQIMKEFANQEKTTPEELLKKDGLVKIESKKKKEVKEHEISDDEYDEIVYGKTKKKKNVKKIVKNLVIYGSIATILGVGIYHLNTKTDIFKKKSNPITSTNNNNISTNKPITNEDKTVVIVDSGVNNGSDYNKTMEGVSNRIEDTNKVIAQLGEDSKVEYSEEQIHKVLNDNARIANASFFEISQFINGGELTGKAYYYNFENNFPKNSVDYNVVKVFSNLRNDIIAASYGEKDRSKTKSEIMDFYSLFTNVVVLDKPMRHGNVDVDFSELSDIAKATILEMGVATFNINLKNYSIDINNKTFTKKDIYNYALQKLEGDLIPNLIDKGYTKK